MNGLAILAIVLAMGLFAALGFFVGYNISTHQFFGGIVGLILAVGLFFSLVFTVKTQNNITTEKYNNGICTICGGNYEFSGATRSNSSQYYFYTCEDCGHTIEVNKIMK